MKVLIVDDEPLARDELSYLLKQNDLIDEINEADGINSAREEIENNRPDLIFLDIQLDDGSGMAFAKGLKKKENCPYIVFGTASYYLIGFIYAFAHAGHGELRWFIGFGSN